MSKVEQKQNFIKKRIDQFAMQDTARVTLGYQSRVASCNRVKAKGAGGREVVHSGVSVGVDGRAHYHGYGACGSVWTCPVCSSKISNVRREEIVNAMRKHSDEGGYCLFITYTFSHSRIDLLKTILNGFLKSLSRMKALRRYKDLLKTIGYVGSIRALEVTHSEENSWHPHAHEVVFIKIKPTKKQIEDIQGALFSMWLDSCKKSGIGLPNEEFGVNVKFDDVEEKIIQTKKKIQKITEKLIVLPAIDGKRFDLTKTLNKLNCDLKYYEKQLSKGAIGTYLAKWGNELTDAMKKNKSTKSGRSPWMILRAMTEQRIEKLKTMKLDARLTVKDGVYYSLRDRDLFREFAKCFEGKRQLFWSRGLKKLFEVGEISDTDAAEKPLKIFIRNFTNEEWLAIMWSGSRARVLEIAENMPLYLDEYISKLCEHRERWRASFKDNKKYYSFDDPVCQPTTTNKPVPSIYLPVDFYKQKEDKT